MDGVAQMVEAMTAIIALISLVGIVVLNTDRFYGRSDSPAFSRIFGASGLRRCESASATMTSAEQRRSRLPTQCSQSEMNFGRCGGRKLVGAFDGGAISSNGGVALLAAADKRIGLGYRLAACFTDHRHVGFVTHALADLLRQRIFALALGHEDLTDHDALRFDPALTAALGKPEDALAGNSTLNRLEHASKISLDPHHKLDHDPAAIERLLVDLFIEAHAKPPVLNRPGFVGGSNP